MQTLNRTYSSPNLRASPIGRKAQWDSYGDDEDEEFYVIGDRVHVDGYRLASVAYFGEVQFASGDWVGVVLDDPSGNHDGKVQGREYFQCAPFHGLFVRPHRVSRIPDSALGSSATSSRVSTPAGQRLGRPGSTSRSPGGASSIMESYFYDEDYRQERTPTVASLMRRLRSIDADHDTGRGRGRGRGTVQSSNSINGLIRDRYGFLQRAPRSQSTEPARSSSNTVNFQSSNTNNLQHRPYSSAGGHQLTSRSPVFNFRPRRVQLDEYYNTNNNEDITSNRAVRRATSVDLSTEPVRVGDRVTVRSEKGQMTGVLKFLGETNFATGEWAGIELDHPEGKNDGSVLGHRYFYCSDNYGLFVPAVRVSKCKPQNSSSSSRTNDSGRIFNAMRSTITSPPPLTYLASTSSSPYDGSYSGAGSRSTTPGYEPTRVCDLISSNKRTHTSGSGLASPSGSHQALRSKFSQNNHLSATPLKLNNNLLNRGTGYFDRRESSSFDSEQSKFDDKEIEFQLRRSLTRPTHTGGPTRVTISSIEPAKPKSVEYTFSSSKYGGNPIARRKVIYD